MNELPNLRNVSEKFIALNIIACAIPSFVYTIIIFLNNFHIMFYEGGKFLSFLFEDKAFMDCMIIMIVSLSMMEINKDIVTMSKDYVSFFEKSNDTENNRPKQPIGVIVYTIICFFLFFEIVYVIHISFKIHRSFLLSTIYMFVYTLYALFSYYIFNLYKSKAMMLPK